MTEEKERAGLGKVVYTTEDQATPPPPAEERVERAEVEEADKESFPASDPPGYSGRSTTECE